MGALEVRRPALPEISRENVMRYLGVKSEYDGFGELYERAVSLISGRLSGSVVYRVFDCTVEGDTVKTESFTVSSKSLAMRLRDCDRVIIAAATVGREVDIIMAKYMHSEPSIALAVGAVGTERIEAVMDSLEREISEKFGKLAPRFSPGYGDLPLDFQRSVFSILTPEKYIGLTLNGSMLMTPSKSVSAVIGIKKTV